MTNPFLLKSIFLRFLIVVLLLLAIYGLVDDILIFRRSENFDKFFLYKNIISLLAVCCLAYLSIQFYKFRKRTGLNYQKIFNGSPYAIYVMEKETLRFLSVNEAMSKLYGYTEQEFLSMSALDIRPETEHVTIKRFLDEFGELTNESGVWLHRKKSGECFYVKITFHSVPLFEKETYLVMVTDIDKSVKDEKKISDLLHLYETVNKATNDVIWDYDLVGDRLQWMQGYKETYGYENDSSPSAFWAMQKVHQEDRERTIEAFRHVVNKKQKSWFAEYRYVCIDGTIKYIADKGYMIFNDDGEPVRMIGAMQDISSQKKYEQQLLHQNEQLKEIAWINSHQVRRPLCNIIGLVDLIKDPENDKEVINHLLGLLSDSSKELDDAITMINQQAKAGKIDLEPPIH